MTVKCPCGKQATFNVGIQDKKPIWCFTCPSKSNEAFNVRCNKCECGKSQPSLGLEMGTPIWCSLCPLKPIEAYNVQKKKCECGKSQPNFGLGDKTPIWCKSCPGKPDDALDVKHKKCECGKSRPLFGIVEKKPIWCFSCPNKSENAFEVVSKKCKENGCFTRPFPKNEYCSTHDPESRKRRFSKQSKVYQFLLENIPSELAEKMKQEKIISNECGFKKCRRDIIIPLSDRIINVEIDEFEHGTENGFYDFRGNGQYTAPCEVKRMYEVAIEDGGNYIQIRFNTDVQRNKDGNPIPKITKERLELLKKVIEECSVMEKVPRFLVIFMFYSEKRFEELQNQFVNGGEDEWVGLGEEIKPFLHLVSYDSMLEFL
jgi:hypothetical protein